VHVVRNAGLLARGHFVSRSMVRRARDTPPSSFVGSMPRFRPRFERKVAYATIVTTADLDRVLRELENGTPNSVRAA
jgi:hypothetical protein